MQGKPTVYLPSWHVEWMDVVQSEGSFTRSYDEYRSLLTRWGGVPRYVFEILKRKVDGLPNYCSKMLRADITNNARAAFMFGNWDRIHDRFPTADVRGIMRIADAEFRACADTQQEWMQRAKNKHLVDIQRAVAVQRALCSQFALQPMPTPGNASEKGTDAS
eukprot:TRINITY_DN3291_c0_g1_i2.p2 TRINITY_DN3291_c0_g1~~TRINITY_DN3291_c0_g1_i2.p2  ORF type:complete len:162 (-),score=32.92 TRINITY_DN3291_c0_g1_i2:13-498(-)